MNATELLLLATGLAMDAFAVSVTSDMVKKNVHKLWALGIALTFGLYQGVMPAIGYALGVKFSKHITKFDHYIALALLGFIGGKMIIDALKHDDEKIEKNAILTFGELMVQGVATSIDALAVGVSFAAMNVNIVRACTYIFVITLVLSFIAVFIGKKFGTLLNNKAEIFGGIILVGIGIKIFIEHTFF